MSAEEGLRAAVVLALALLPLGDLALGWAGLRGVSAVDRIVLAGGVGYVLACALYYALGLAGLTVLFPAAVLGAAVPWWLRRRRSAPLEAGSPWDGAFLAATGLALAWILRGYAPFTPVPDGLAYDHNHDLLVHCASLWELRRVFPPEQTPYLAGEPFPPYHVFSYLPWLWLVEYGGLGVLTALHRALPVLHLGLAAGGLYVAVGVRTSDRRLGLAAVVAFFFVGGVLEAAFVHRLVGGLTPLEYALRSPSGAGSFAVGATAFALLSLFDRRRSLGEPAARLLYLAASVLGLLYLVKAQAFLLLGGSFLLALAVARLAGRDRTREVWIAGALVVALVGALRLSWRSAGDFGTIRWQTGAFAEEVVLPWLARDPVPFVSQVLFPAVERLPGGWLAATALGLWRLAHLSPLVAGFLVHRVRRAAQPGLCDATAAAVLPVGFLMACGLTASEFSSGPQLARQALYAVPLLATGVDVALLGYLARRAGRSGAWVLLGVAVLAAALAPLVVATQVHEKDGALLVLGPDEQRALRYLRDATPEDAVVLSARTWSFRTLADTYGDWERFAVVSGIAGRRAFHEYAYADTPAVLAREEQKLRFFSTDDEDVALRILRRQRVDFVMEYAGRPFGFRPRRLLLCLDAGSVRVWARESCPPEGPPARDLR